MVSVRHRRVVHPGFSLVYPREHRMHEELHPLLAQGAQVSLTPLTFKDGIEVARLEVHTPKGVIVQQLAMSSPLDLRRLATLAGIAHRQDEQTDNLSGLFSLEAVARRIAAMLIVLWRRSDERGDDPLAEMPDPPGTVRIRRSRDVMDDDGVDDDTEEEVVNVADLMLHPLTLIFGPQQASRVLMRTAELVGEDDVYASVGRAKQTLARLFGANSADAFEDDVQGELRRMGD